MNEAQKERLKQLKSEARKKLGVDTIPPDNRVSIFGSTHYATPDNEWIFAEGIGWYHQSEAFYFKLNYFLSSVSNKFFKSTEKVALGKANNWLEGSFCAKSELKELGLMVCAHTNTAYPKDQLIEALGNRGEKIFVRNTLVGPGDHCTYRVCSLSKKAVHTSQLMESCSRTLPYISRYARTCPEFGDKLVECRHCGRTGLVEEVIRREGIGRNNICCEDCYDKALQANLIHDYNYSEYPSPIIKPHKFIRMEKGKMVAQNDDYFRMYGVECEVEINDHSTFNRYKLAAQAYKALGRDFIIIKRDGSLNMHDHTSELCGFEIVSAPADIETHREKWEKFETMEGFKYLRAWDTKTCGMHVHVSRNVLTTLQIGRIIHFVGVPGNRKFIAHIAGRSGGPNGYNKIIEKKLGDGLRPDPDKYVAVNTKHKATIEFRIFRGTVRFRHIMRNIEFVDAVCSFCHPATRSLLKMEYKDFCAYVGERRKQYPMLAEWLAVQKYIKPNSLPPGSKAVPVVEAELVEKGEASR